MCANVASVWLRIHVKAAAHVPGYWRVEGPQRELPEEQFAAQATDQ